MHPEKNLLTDNKISDHFNEAKPLPEWAIEERKTTEKPTETIAEKTYNRNPKLWSHESLLILGYKPGDRISVAFIAPKNIPPEELLERGLGFIPEGKEKPIAPAIMGYIDLREDGTYSYTRQKNIDGVWVDHPSFRVYNDGYKALKAFNKKGYGIYFRPNQGGHYDSNIVECPALFYECDGKTKEEQWGLVKKNEALGFFPALVVETRNSLHVYYRISETEPEGWRQLQQRLIQMMDSDPSIHNEARLMRLPGFDHWKYNAETLTLEDTRVRVRDYCDNIYSREQFNEILPVLDPVKVGDHEKKAREKRAKSPTTTDYNALSGIENPFDMRHLAPYQEGYDASGRSGFMTFKCPVHGGQSLDSVHVSHTTGGFAAHCGCDRRQVYRTCLDIAKASGYVIPKQAPNDNTDNATSDGESKAKTEYTAKEKYEYAARKEYDKLCSVTPGKNWHVIKNEGEYLNPATLQQIKEKGGYGVVFIKGAPGCGKTEYINSGLELFPEKNVTVVVPTQALGNTVESRFKDVYFRDNAHIQGLSLAESVRLCERLAICYPSLNELIKRRADGSVCEIKDVKNSIIVIDEIVAGLEFLIQSSLANSNGKRPDNILGFESLFRNAEENRQLIFISDAYLSMIQILYILNLLPKDYPIYYVTNEKKQKQREVEILVDAKADKTKKEKSHKGASQARFFGKIKHNLEENKNSWLATDSQEDGEEQERQALKLGVNNVLRADSKTSINPEVKSLFKDPAGTIADLKPLLFEYSPSCKEGLSITVTVQHAVAQEKLRTLKNNNASSDEIAEQEELVKNIRDNWKQYDPYFLEGFYVNKHFLVNSSLQQISRDRNFPKLTIWLGDKEPETIGCPSPFVDAQKKYFMDRLEGLEFLNSIARKNLAEQGNCEPEATQIINEYKNIIRNADEENNAIFLLYCRQCAKAAYERSHRRELLVEALEKEGHIVKVTEVRREEVSNEEGQLREDIKEGKETARVETSKREINSELITKEEFQKLAKKNFISLEVEAKKTRYMIEQEFPGFIDSLPRDKREEIYHALFSGDREWIKAESARYEFEHRKQLYSRDACKMHWSLFYMARADVPCPQDLLKLHSGRIKFIEDWGLLEQIDPEKIYKSTDVLPLIKTTDKFRKKLQSFFKVTLPTDTEKLSKQCVRIVNAILEIFNMKLVKVGKSGKIIEYQLQIKAEPEGFEGLREKLTDSLDRKWEKYQGEEKQAPNIYDIRHPAAWQEDAKEIFNQPITKENLENSYSNSRTVPDLEPFVVSDDIPDWFIGIPEKTTEEETSAIAVPAVEEVTPVEEQVTEVKSSATPIIETKEEPVSVDEEAQEVYSKLSTYRNKLRNSSYVNEAFMLEMLTDTKTLIKKDNHPDITLEKVLALFQSEHPVDYAKFINVVAVAV